MKKRISMFAALLIVVLMTATVMFACSSNKTTSVQGKYYSYEDGVKDRDSYIELKSGKKWTDGEFSGEYTLKGSSISLLLDGEEMMSGTVENGVLTLDFWGMTTVYYKDGAYPSNSGNGSGGGSGSGSGGGNNGGNSSVEPVEPDEKARIESIVNGSVDGLDCYIDVSPSTTSIDLSGSIEVSKDSSWQLYADVLGQTLIPTKYAANLVDGDNIYYVVVNSADGTVNRTYTLHIWRNFYVDVVFYSQGEVVKTLTRTTHTDISKDEFVEVSATGYTFTGWKTDWREHTAGEDYYITGYDGYGTLTKTIAFEAQFSANKYTITLDDNGGTGSTGSVEVTYANYFELPVPSRTGYTFDGWEYNGTKITTSSGSCIKGYAYDKDITAKARWNINSYQLTVNNDGNHGSVTSSGTRQYNSSVTITATPNAGYTFAGWYKGGTKVSDRTSYTFTMPANDVTYTAKWKANTYTITLDANGGNCGTSSKEVTYADSYTLPVPTRTGYTFEGWKYNGTTIVNASGASVSAYGYLNNITATATWTINSYYVTVNKNGNYGSVTSSGSYKYNSNVTLTASTKPGYTWLGWYDGDTKVSEGNSLTHTFTMPANNLEYTAKWEKCEDHTYENGNCTKCDKGEWYDVVDEDTILFGSYPQTRVTDVMLISTLNNTAGTLPTSSNSQSWTSYGYYYDGVASNFMWYIDVENGEDKYRGVYFTLYRPYKCDYIGSTGHTYQDDNGYLVSDEQTTNIYWFKYEPISWTILEEKGGNAYLLCDMIIDSQQFGYEGGDVRNYRLSTIREWLNDTFYNTAFNQYEQEIILTTTVDNSAESTGYYSNSYACSNTEDKVFLLSRKEATTYFAKVTEQDPARRKKTTDYAQSQGSYMYSGSTEEYLGNGWWWLRSPHYNPGNTSDIFYCDYDGTVDGAGRDLHYTYMGVVPALQIQL